MRGLTMRCGEDSDTMHPDAVIGQAYTGDVAGGAVGFIEVNLPVGFASQASCENVRTNDQQ